MFDDATKQRLEQAHTRSHYRRLRAAGVKALPAFIGAKLLGRMQVVTPMQFDWMAMHARNWSRPQLENMKSLAYTPLTGGSDAQV